MAVAQGQILGCIKGVFRQFEKKLGLETIEKVVPLAQKAETPVCPVQHSTSVPQKQKQLVHHDHLVYQSESPGVSDVVLPSSGVYNYDHHLVGIEVNTTYENEFNFVLSSGEHTKAPMKGSNKRVIKLDDGVISKIVVCYEKKYMVAGMKFYDKEGSCILEVGSFEWGAQ